MKEAKGYKITDQYACYFVTFTIVGWVDVFTRKECKEIIIDSLKYCQKNKGLVVHAYVIMSSHIHMVLSAQEGSIGLSNIIRDFKRHTSKMILKWVLESGRESRKEWLCVVFNYHAKHNSNNSDYQVWKQDNKPKECIHPKFTMQKINYIHNNPIEAGLVGEPQDYRCSSARNYLDMVDNMLDVDVIDYGIQEGYIAI